MAKATSATYVRVGLILAVLTLIEFGVLRVEALRPIAVWILLLLAVAKFFLVAQYFMHLRYEHRGLLWLFGGGIVLAVSIWYSVWAIFYHRLPETLP